MIEYKRLKDKHAMGIITTERAREQRAKEVENALASVRIEGFEPSEEAKAMFQHYVDGELTSEELDRAFDRHLDRKYGPVRLSRNECS
jgi:hypothetical protein